VTHFALVVMDQKANPAYPGFYNGGFTSWGMARVSGGRKSPSGVQGHSPGSGPGRSSPEAEAKCVITIQLLTFSSRQLRI